MTTRRPHRNHNEKREYQMSILHTPACDRYLQAAQDDPLFKAMVAEFRKLPDDQIRDRILEYRDDDLGTPVGDFMRRLWPLLQEYMTVTVRDRSAEAPWGSGPIRPIIRKVTISAFCPTCGGRRGEPRGLNQCEDGEHYWVQIWDNPCGHVDSYAAVVAEAKALEAER